MTLSKNDMLKEITEADTNMLFNDSKELYQFIYDTLLSKYKNYTDDEIKTYYNDIFGD